MGAGKGSAEGMAISEIQAEEEFIVEVQYAIQKVLNDHGINYAQLAGKLGISKARVSQMFGDEASNLTLRTVARIFNVIGDRAIFSSEYLEEIAARGKHGKALSASLCAMSKNKEIPLHFIGAIMLAKDTSKWSSEKNQNNEITEAA